MGALIATIHVHEIPTGEDKHIFSPGDDVPEWAARQMGAHCFEDGDHPFPDGGATGGKEREAGTPPPKAGHGSSAKAWAEYAAEQGVVVPEGANRDAIVAALVDAGKPVDPQ